MERERVTAFLTFGAGGAFMAALVVVSIFAGADATFNWTFVGVAAVFGFLLGGFLGQPAIDFLGKLWWWR